MNSIVNLIDLYGGEINLVLVAMLVSTTLLLCWLWLYNRRKYQHLKHQIPANIVKNYLDSIIQNSTALKSSLFRGGGLDIDASALPSVMPLSELSGQTQVGFDSNDAAELKARIASLEGSLGEKNKIVGELEDKYADVNGDNRNKERRIKDLEEQLAGSELGAADESIVDDYKREVQSLEEQLKEYDIIAADISNMKRLQEENRQLKASLESVENGSKEKVSDPVVADDSAPVKEEPAEVATEEVIAKESTDEPVAATEEEVNEVVAEAEPEQEEQSAEDLLEEFEKMLG